MATEKVILYKNKKSNINIVVIMLHVLKASCDLIRFTCHSFYAFGFVQIVKSNGKLLSKLL